MGANAKNSFSERKADDVLRAIRNALAHGNIMYLNERDVALSNDCADLR